MSEDNKDNENYLEKYPRLRAEDYDMLRREERESHERRMSNLNESFETYYLDRSFETDCNSNDWYIYWIIIYIFIPFVCGGLVMYFKK